MTSGATQTIYIFKNVLIGVVFHFPFCLRPFTVQLKLCIECFTTSHNSGTSVLLASTKYNVSLNKCTEV